MEVFVDVPVPRFDQKHSQPPDMRAFLIQTCGYPSDEDDATDGRALQAVKVASDRVSRTSFYGGSLFCGPSSANSGLCNGGRLMKKRRVGRHLVFDQRAILPAAQASLVVQQLLIRVSRGGSRLRSRPTVRIDARLLGRKQGLRAGRRARCDFVWFGCATCESVQPDG